MGVTPDRIVYANTIKSTSHLKYASEHGVTLMTFDSAEELVKMDDKNASFHVGCAYTHPDIFVHTIDHAKRVFDLGTEMGFRMNVLDIGGGFPGGLRKQDTMAEVCGAIRSAIDKQFPPSSGVKIIAEPGQFFVTAAYSLVVRVVGKRQREISIDAFMFIVVGFKYFLIFFLLLEVGTRKKSR
ncbi:ornithine decarboxylase-like [Ixodes scapularis]